MYSQATASPALMHGTRCGNATVSKASCARVIGSLKRAESTPALGCSSGKHGACGLISPQAERTLTQTAPVSLVLAEGRRGQAPDPDLRVPHKTRSPVPIEILRVRRFYALIDAVRSLAYEELEDSGTPSLAELPQELVLVVLARVAESAVNCVPLLTHVPTRIANHLLIDIAENHTNTARVVMDCGDFQQPADTCPAWPLLKISSQVADAEDDDRTTTATWRRETPRVNHARSLWGSVSLPQLESPAYAVSGSGDPRREHPPPAELGLAKEYSGCVDGDGASDSSSSVSQPERASDARPRGPLSSIIALWRSGRSLR